MTRRSVLARNRALATLSNEKQTLEGRWTWMDRDGFQLDDGTRAWKTVFVNALEEQKIMGRSPNAKAVRGTYELRYHSGVTDGDE